MNENALDFFRLGKDAYAAWEHEKAIEYFNRAIALEPNFALAYAERGLAHAAIDKFCEESFDDFDLAIKIDPLCAIAYANRAIVYSAIGYRDLALENFNKAIECDPNCFIALINRGLAHDNLGDFTAAIADYNRAIELNPASAEAHNNRGADYYEIGEYELAFADYEAAIAIDSNLAQAYFNRGVFLCEQKGEFVKAICDFDRVLSLAPEYDAAYLYRAIAKAKNKDMTGAGNDAKKAVNIINDAAWETLKRLGVKID